MIKNLLAQPGQPNRVTVLEYFRKLRDPSVLLPGREELEAIPLQFVPLTPEDMKALVNQIGLFNAGHPAVHAFPPHPDPLAKPVPGVKTAAQVVPKVVGETAAKSKDPMWWRNVIVSRPRKGMKKAEYDKHPDTLGSLYDMRHGNDEEAEAARHRLWGLAEHEPAPREYNGRTYQPTNADWDTYYAAQAFKAWFEKNHPDEKL